MRFHENLNSLQESTVLAVTYKSIWIKTTEIAIKDSLLPAHVGELGNLTSMHNPLHNSSCKLSEHDTSKKMGGE